MTNNTPKPVSKAAEKAAERTADLDSKIIELQKSINSAHRERDSALVRVNEMVQKVEDLEKQNGQLRSMAQKLIEDAPPELGDGIYQLSHSVLLKNADSGDPASGKPGDVVVMVSEDGKPGAAKRDCESIAKRLGPGYRAYPISRKTLEELQSKGMLRG